MMMISLDRDFSPLGNKRRDGDEMMDILIIDEKVRQEIRRVKKNAEENPITFIDLINQTPLGGDDRFHLHIPPYKVNYTHEDQDVNGMWKHLSILINKPGIIPKMIAIRMIRREFEFVNKLIDVTSPGYINIPEPGHLMWWSQKFRDGCISIHIMEPLNGNYE